MNKTIANKIAKEIFDDDYFKELFQKSLLISAKSSIYNSPNFNGFSPKEFNDTLRFADILSNSDMQNARNKAYQIITYLNPAYNSNPLYQSVSKAVYSNLGNFPAVLYLKEKNNNDAELPFDRLFEVEAKKLVQIVPGSEKLIFTDSQYKLYSQLKNSVEFSFSGPTSMGKSFIIKAFISKALENSPPENLAIIVPTRALINQFTIELKNELKDVLERYRYKVVTNSNISDLISDEPFNYILVLTPERLISFITQNQNPPIGFLFVDEAHKLAQNKDSRSVTTYTAIEKTLKKYGNIKLYFASPNVSNPEVFLKLFNRKKTSNYFRTNESPVAQNLYLIDLEEKNISLIKEDEELSIESESFFDNGITIFDVILKLGLNQNNLIYCNSKNKTIYKAQNFSKYLSKPNELNKSVRKAVRQIKSYIHKDYFLADLISKGIAYHFGNLPQLIRNIVEDLYKSEQINNVFCTSTLLEGVNMPTQNLFILDNRKGSHSALTPIDFWNLSGRAGRLTKELLGNVYCIKYDECKWEDKSLLRKIDIELKPTVLDRIERNLKKIEKLISEKNISGTETEKEILAYIANIICVDTLEVKSNYKSPLIEKLISAKKEQIIDLAKNKVSDFKIPHEILNANESIKLITQNKVYRKLKNRVKNRRNIKLPSTINYETCLEVLQGMYNLYDWESAEKKVQHYNSLKYYAMLMNQWINDISLSQMIKQSIDYHDNYNKEIWFNYQKEQFDINNKWHVNAVIETLIDDIERILRFIFEKYFNHYYLIVSNLLGEENAGENWATLLEYGTKSRILIALQNIGLSRHSAGIIFRDFKNALEIKDNKLISIDKASILNRLNNNSIEFDEINQIL